MQAYFLFDVIVCLRCVSWCVRMWVMFASGLVFCVIVMTVLDFLRDRCPVCMHLNVVVVVLRCGLRCHLFYVSD
jgi:xanthine/uracil/vitamin C permease (AzgA family)